jgi:hypothetical protein
MSFLDPMDLEFEDDGDPSTGIDTETLAANDLIQEDFAEGSDRSPLPKQWIGGREFWQYETNIRDWTNLNSVSISWVTSAYLGSTYTRYTTGPTAMQQPQFVISENNLK